MVALPIPAASAAPVLAVPAEDAAEDPSQIKAPDASCGQGNSDEDPTFSTERVFPNVLEPLYSGEQQSEDPVQAGKIGPSPKREATSASCTGTQQQKQTGSPEPEDSKPQTSTPQGSFPPDVRAISSHGENLPNIAPGLPNAAGLKNAIPERATQAEAASPRKRAVTDQAPPTGGPIPGVELTPTRQPGDFQNGVAASDLKIPLSRAGEVSTSGSDTKPTVAVRAGHSANSTGRIGKVAGAQARPASHSVGMPTNNKESLHRSSSAAVPEGGPDDDPGPASPPEDSAARTPADASPPVSGGQAPSTAADSAVPSPSIFDKSQHDAACLGNDRQAMRAADSSGQSQGVAPRTLAVNSVRILEHAGQSEMRLGVNSADFGPIEVHTSLSQDRVEATVSTGHADLRAAMRAEMQSLNRAIESHQLRLEHFDVGTRNGGQGSSRFTDHQPPSPRDMQFSVRRVNEAASAVAEHEPSAWLGPQSVRLSVIA